MRRLVLTPLVAVATALAIAGCGGGSTTTSTTQAFDQAAFQQLQTCLEQHGVKAPQMPAPSSGGQPPAEAPPSGGEPTRKMQKAFDACRQYAPQGALITPPSGAPPASQGG